MFIYPTDTAERVAPNKCYRLVTEGHVLFPTPLLDYTSQRVIVESHYTLYIYMHSMLHRALGRTALDIASEFRGSP